MNEELQKQIAEIIGGITKSVGEGKDLAISQAPDIIKQYLYWGIAEGVIALIVIIALCVVYYKLFTKWSVEWNEWDRTPARAIIGVIVGAICFGLFIPVGSAAKIVVAPKVYLLERGANLVSKVVK